MKISLRKPKAATPDVSGKLPRKKAKTKGMAAFTRFVLVIGEEGAILIHLDKGKVLGRYFTSDLKPDNIQTIQSVLEANVDIPLYVAVDTHDQFYVQQNLPPVAAMSVSKLIKRRINREFPNHKLKGSITLGREGSGARKDWSFMIVALEETPLMHGWIEWITVQPNRCLGIHLLPVETASLIKLLAHAPDQEQPDNEWLFLVTHNKVSGFRQVILKNGKIIFTRLGQPLGDENAEVAAGTIEQEIQSTIEYLKRLGLKDGKAVSMYIVCAEDIKKTIDPNKFGGAHTLIYTPHQLAEKIKLEGATQESDRFGDVVVGSYVGCQRKAELPLLTPALTKIQNLYKILPMEKAVAALAALGLFYMIGTAAYDYFFLQGDVSKLELQKSTKQKDLEQLKKESSQTNEDIEKISDFVTVYDAFNLEAYSPVPTFYRLSQVLDETIRVKTMSWEVAASAGKDGKPAAPAAGAKATESGKLSVVFLDFPKTNDAAQKYTQDLLDKIKTKLGDYQVKYETLKGVVKESDKFDVAIGQAEESKGLKKEEGSSADISFTGPVITTGEEPPKDPKAAAPVGTAPAAAPMPPGAPAAPPPPGAAP